MIKLATSLSVFLIVGVRIADAATDWLTTIDRFARADAAASVCAKPAPPLRQSFVTNYEATVARAKVQLKQQYPTYSDSTLTELVRQRAKRGTDGVAMLLKQKGCRSAEINSLLGDYQKLAGGVMFPLR